MPISLKPTGPVATDPGILILYGQPKCGKTTALANLAGCYTCVLDPGGRDYLTMWGDEYLTPEQLGDAWRELEALPAESKPRFLALDTVDKLEDWAEVMATTYYKGTVIGSTFKGNSVLELPKGGGYMYLRAQMTKLVNAARTVTEHLILIGHVRDSSIDKGTADVASKDLALTGKVRQITCAMADAIGYIYRDRGSNLMVSFMTQEGVICGGRCPHLAGKIIELCSWNKGQPQWHWERIYTQLSPTNNN